MQAGPKFLKERQEFDNLIKGIGECKSKAEEDRIIGQEVEVLKQRLSDPKLDKSRGREYMVRLIYCEMLGHDAGFAYIKALQFASDANIHTKKVRAAARCMNASRSWEQGRVDARGVLACAWRPLWPL